MNQRFVPNYQVEQSWPINLNQSALKVEFSGVTAQICHDSDLFTVNGDRI